MGRRLTPEVHRCTAVVGLTERFLDVLLSRIDFGQELLEELEASPQPQQSLSGRVAHLGDLRLHFVQHDGLQRGVDVWVGFQLLVDFLEG